LAITKISSFNIMYLPAPLSHDTAHRSYNYHGTVHRFHGTVRFVFQRFIFQRSLQREVEGFLLDPRFLQK